MAWAKGPHRYEVWSSSTDPATRPRRVSSRPRLWSIGCQRLRYRFRQVAAKPPPRSLASRLIGDSTWPRLDVSWDKVDASRARQQGNRDVAGSGMSLAKFF